MSDLEAELRKTGSSNLGLTTTVKDQVEHIECTIEHFRKTIDSQKKQQSELQFQLRKLEELTLVQFDELEKELGGRINYLTEVRTLISQAFRNDHAAEEKQLDYLELQNATLTDEHKKLTEMGEVLEGRIERTEANVGI